VAAVSTVPTGEKYWTRFTDPAPVPVGDPLGGDRPRWRRRRVRWPVPSRHAQRRHLGVGRRHLDQAHSSALPVAPVRRHDGVRPRGPRHPLRR
jgi:hypothetical protein